MFSVDRAVHIASTLACERKNLFFFLEKHTKRIHFWLIKLFHFDLGKKSETDLKKDTIYNNNNHQNR